MVESEIILGVVLIVCGGFFKSICDSLMFRDRTPLHSIFVKIFGEKFFNKTDITWVNKWKNGDREQGERFFGSSSFLVFLTDGWHLFQFLEYMCLCNVIAMLATNTIHEHVCVTMCCYMLFGGSFEFFFGKKYK